MKIGFTGTQKGMTNRQKQALATWLEQAAEFHHGDCIGADAQAHTLAQFQHCPIIIHPPINSTKRARCSGALVVRPMKEYLARNHDIVDETDVLVAAPATHIEQMRSGTWATVRYARKKGKSIAILFP